MCPGHPIGEGLIVCRKCQKIYLSSASEEEKRTYDFCNCDGEKYRFLRSDRWEKIVR